MSIRKAFCKGKQADTNSVRHSGAHASAIPE
jgi:hypothetical protein